MYRTSFLIFSCLLLLAFSLQATAITCNDRGECAGDGAPTEETRCSGCHSCTFNNCCHVRFTNVNTKCNIPGWRSDEYKVRWGEGQ